MQVNDYVTLGRTGLRVSPLCLGTMTFGNGGPGSADEAVAQAMLARYVEAGGNFIDTADVYGGGRSEEIIGRFVSERRLRDHVVLATKFSFAATSGNPNAGGNGRKNVMRALEGSLARLRTDYVDLYYLHAWDTITPAEEVVATLTDLVRAGRIRHFGISDAPAWYVARVQTLAEREGLGQVAAIQHEYSLVERTIEREHVPAAQALGIGVCAWGPLAGGLLSGKYRRAAAATPSEDGRLRNSPQVWDRFTERNLSALESLVAIAESTGLAPAALALNWVVHRAGITSTLLGATRLDQLEAALRSAALAVPRDVHDALDRLAESPLEHPYKIFGAKMQAMLAGGTGRRAWRPADVYADLAAPMPPEAT